MVFVLAAMRLCFLLLLSALWWMKLRGLCKLPDERDWWWEKLGLDLVDRALLSKALIQLSADGWGCARTLIAFWPEVFRSIGSIVKLVATSIRVYAKADLPISCWQQTRPCVELLLTHTSSGRSPTLASSFVSVSCGVTIPLGLGVVKILFVLSRTGIPGPLEVL